MIPVIIIADMPISVKGSTLPQAEFCTK